MKRRLAQSFMPEAIASKLSERKRVQDEINATFEKLKSLWNPADFNENNLTLTEDQALLLISSKLSFYGVLVLKLALNHVPVTYRTTLRGTSTPIRYTLVAGIMNKKGFSVSPCDVQKYAEVLERFCQNFLFSTLQLQDVLWELTAEGEYRFNKFIAPPVESCLKCDETLGMHNRPSKAVVYGSGGPLPASKITLECKHCKIQYGVGHFSDDSGRHLYPRNIQSPLIEASNVSYMERDLYRWIPSLGNHCWVSFSGFSETYNEIFSQEVEKFITMVPGPDEDGEVDADADLTKESADSDKIEIQTSAGESSSTLTQDKSTKANLPGEISSKCVAKFYWKQELAEELEDLGLHGKWVFAAKTGPLSGLDEDAMEHVEKIRSENLYSHDCTPGCQQKGQL